MITVKGWELDKSRQSQSLRGILFGHEPETEMNIAK